MNVSTHQVCADCIGEDYLQQEITQDGESAVCHYCEDKGQCVSLEWLADNVYFAITNHFKLTPTEPSGLQYMMLRDKEINYDWYRDGQPVNDLIQEIAHVDEPIATDVQEYLSNTHMSYDDLQLGEEDPFGDEAHYEETPAEHYGAMESWNSLCSEIKSRARFFSPVTEQILNELFGEVNSFKTYDGTPVVRTISTEGELSVLYRARVAQSESDISKILENPVTELGPPPSKHAQAGRMNAVGISVFYGATDPETCIAEIRPPVGSNAIVGKFSVTRDIRLLDMDILTKVHKEGSYFNPESSAHWGHAAFLRQLVHELTQPVMPGDEQFEYLPTQAIAEYLSERINPRLDGIIFQSSQISNDGRNVVLFNHASRVQPYELPPGTNVSINFGFATEEDHDDSITVWEEIPKDSSEDEKNNTTDSDFPAFDLDTFLQVSDIDTQDYHYDSRSITLTLDVGAIEVHTIDGVGYDTGRRLCSRYRDNE